MDDFSQIYPLEFYIQGTPRSLQAQNKADWKADVAGAAKSRIDEMKEWFFLDERPLALTIYFFPVAPWPGDVDNIVKPIQDALIKVAYRDDHQVERVVVQKFEPEEDWDILEPSARLAEALDIAPPVVYVRVDDDLGWRNL